MAQVYRFTDENGQVRLFAEIAPEPAGTFNGGVITTPLEIDNDAAAHVPLTVKAHPSTQTNDLLDVIYKDGSSYPFWVASNGAVNVEQTADSGGVPALFVKGKNTLAGGVAVFKVSNGNNEALYTVDQLGHSVLAGSSDLSASQTFLEVVDGGSHPVMSCGNGPRLGFFGTAPATKPAVVGAKLPSDVALASLLTALSGLGLITDSTT